MPNRRVQGLSLKFLGKTSPIYSSISKISTHTQPMDSPLRQSKSLSNSPPFYPQACTPLSPSLSFSSSHSIPLYQRALLLPSLSSKHEEAKQTVLSPLFPQEEHRPCSSGKRNVNHSQKVKKKNSKLQKTLFLDTFSNADTDEAEEENMTINRESPFLSSSLFGETESIALTSQRLDLCGCDALEETATASLPCRAFPSTWQKLRMLLKRREVWAICICQYCQSWGLYGLISWLPTYFEESFHVDYHALAILAALPYVGQSLMAFMAGFIADFLLRKGYSVYGVRVSLQSLSMIVPAIFLLFASTLAVSPIVASLYIFFGTSMNALSCAAVSVNQLDIAPEFAGLVFGAGNTFGILAGILAVPISGFVLQFTHSWTAVFSIFSIHYILGAILWARWIGVSPLHFDDVYTL